MTVESRSELALDRRALLKTALAAMLARPPSRAGRIRSAEEFIDSFGVNVHIDSRPYGHSFDRFAELIGMSGIRHIRFEPLANQDLGRLRDLDDRFGIRCSLLMSPTNMTVSQLVACIDALEPHRVSAVEGQNEADSEWFRAQKAAGEDWVNATLAFQRSMFEALRPRYPASVLPILSPSVLDWKPRDMALLRPAAAYCDIVSIHSYVQRAQEPETGDSYAGLAWYLRNMRDSFKPGAPVMATEVGYNNSVRPGGAGVSEAAAAIYLPRLLLNNFAAGVLRTFLYEFMDSGGQAWDSHWGLLHHDGRPKPAYQALRALLSALGEPGVAAPARRARGQPPRLSILGAPPEARSQIFRKRDGSIVVALWRAVPSWDVARAADLTVAPVRLVVTTEPAVVQAGYMIPNESAGWKAVPVTDGKITLPVADKIVLLRL
jgi:hypothetical protein